MPSALRRTPPRDAARRLATWLATPLGLGFLFAAGVVIRLVLARGGGFPFDMSSFQAWAVRAAERGPWHFYPSPSERYFVDYPPGYLYVLWLIGLAAKAVGGSPSIFVLKLPPIAADLALAWVVALLAERLTPPEAAKRWPPRGVAAACILLNPAIFFVSAVWGQVDAFLALSVAGAALLLGTGEPLFRRDAGGMALLAIAVATKPQGAFVLPVVGLLIAWRYVRPSLAGEAPFRRGAPLASGVERAALLGAVGLLAGLLVLAPFHLGPVSALRFYARSARTYPVTSVFAFNLWGAVGVWRPDLGRHAVRLLGLPALVWGLLAFAAGGEATLSRAWGALRRGQDEGRVFVFGSMALSLVGFAVLTRIHERYLFLPLALGASLVGYRFFRRAFVVLSALYLINVYYPYVYYLRYVHRPAITLGGLFDAFYGRDITGPHLRLLAAVTTLASLGVAWLGWRRLERPAEAEPEPRAAVPTTPPQEAPRRFVLRLHGPGRREVVLAGGIFLVALVSRMAMLGHPPGMYFDEVYHARTGAEYLGGKEVFEWTHPPLAKEMIGFSIQHASNFLHDGSSRLPGRVVASTLAPAPGGMVWAERSGDASIVVRGGLDASCRLGGGAWRLRTPVRATAVAASGTSTYVAGRLGGQAVLERDDGMRLAWRATLPAPPTEVALAGQRAYVLTSDHELVAVSPEGVPTAVAVGAAALASGTSDGLVWASFPGEDKVAAWGGEGRREKVVEVGPHPRGLADVDLAQRVWVAADGKLVSVESDEERVEATVPGGARALASPPETGLVWAASGRELRVIEPHAAVVIGRVRLRHATARLLSDPVRHRVVAVSQSGLECASGRPQFAWRLGSAVFGSAMVALVALLSFVLFGNVWAALLASLFLAVDGLTFTVSRIAMLDAYATAFLLGAWLCTLLALREFGCRVEAGGSERRRGRALAWLASGGALAGLACASKWIGIYALAGISLVLLWDGFARGRESIWRIAGGAGPSMVLIVLFYAVVPAAVYVASYRPYFTLGHSFGDFLRLQRQMFDYHAGLRATHPFSSPWYGWPFGYKAVFLYLRDTGNGFRSEIWTIPNIVLFWTGLVAAASAVERAVRERSAALGIVLIAALVQYLPWVPVTRVLFMYHYFAVVPFLAILLAWWLVVGRAGRRHDRLVAAGVAACAVAFFLAVFPMLVGWSMPAAYLDGVRRMLPWVIR